MNRWKKQEKPTPSRYEDTKGQTESFATRNVRLITFLVCMGVFLAAFIPLGVVGVSKFSDWIKNKELPALTVNDVVRFSEREDVIKLSDLTKYQGDVQDYAEHDTVFVAEFGHYHVRAVANKSTEIVDVFIMIDTETGKQYDVLKDDLRPLFQFGQD